MGRGFRVVDYFSFLRIPQIFLKSSCARSDSELTHPLGPAQLFSFTESRGEWGPRLVHGLHRGSAVSWPVWRVHCPALPLAVTLGSTCGAFSGGGVSTWWTRWSHRK